MFNLFISFLGRRIEVIGNTRSPEISYSKINARADYYFFRNDNSVSKADRIIQAPGPFGESFYQRIINLKFIFIDPMSNAPIYTPQLPSANELCNVGEQGAIKVCRFLEPVYILVRPK